MFDTIRVARKLHKNSPNILKKWPKIAKAYLESPHQTNLETLKYLQQTMCVLFWLKRVLDRGPEHRESKMTVLCPLIIIILIMENHPSQNWKQN